MEYHPSDIWTSNLVASNTIFPYFSEVVKIEVTASLVSRVPPLVSICTFIVAIFYKVVGDTKGAPTVAEILMTKNPILQRVKMAWQHTKDELDWE